jgi:hypothetical protein
MPQASLKIVILLGMLSVTPLLAQDLNASAAMPATQLTIESISVVGTNLSIVAAIPPGLDQVALEISAALNGDWQEAGPVNLPQGGQLTFTIPKPATPMAFFRLKAKRHLESAPLLSSELQYVATPSLAANLSENGDAVFHFKGLVDGSDKIVITRDGALWNHINWDWPHGAVTINGTQWKPQQKNFVTTTGTSKFLPETFSLDSVTLETIQGRDIVALERSANALIVYLNDTPIGPSEYEFNIHFHPTSTAVGRAPALRSASDEGGSPRADVSQSAHLKIAARIDGSDCLTITPTQAIWNHKFHACPTSVTLNDVHWNPKKNKILKNEGTNTFLPTNVDLSTAKIVCRKGRDLATLWANPDSLQVYFADNPNGNDSYELEISFGEPH